MARQSGGFFTVRNSPETARLPVKFINQREFEDVARKAKAATLNRQSPKAFANLRLRSKLCAIFLDFPESSRQLCFPE
jgi:hypothetical protein